MAQLVGALSHDLKGHGSDFRSGNTSLGGGFGPRSEHLREESDRRFSLTLMFLSLPPSLPLSLKSISMSLGEDKTLKIYIFI